MLFAKIYFRFKIHGLMFVVFVFERRFVKRLYIVLQYPHHSASRQADGIPFFFLKMFL